MEESYLELPVRRWRLLVASAWFSCWLGAIAGAVVWLRAQPTDRAQVLTTIAIMAATGLFVVGVQVVRQFGDAALTATPEHLRCHAGDVPAVRWGRIRRVQLGRFGKLVTLDLHGRSQPTEIPGSRWLTQAERAELGRWLQQQRREALREQRRRELR